MNEHSRQRRSTLPRRAFLGWASRRGAGLVLMGTAGPALLAACGSDDDPDIGAAPSAGGATTTTSEAEAAEQAQAIVGDVIDFSLTPGGWEGAFGFVTMALRKGVIDGNDVYYVRTDTSDQGFAEQEQLVWVPKLSPLTGEGLSGAMYVVEGGAEGQAIVLSSEPGRDDYTPAWTLHRVRWTGAGSPRLLTSVADVRDAEGNGALSVERTEIVVNAGVVKWSNGGMPVDRERVAYLGQGQLLEEPDTTTLRATFKLSQCYPGSRYFVLDHSIAPAAEMTSTAFSPRLHAGPSQAGATGRTNVFMNGVEGPGPMGFQPSAFDFAAGEPAWSPYWDHYTYAWRDGTTPRVLASQTEVHDARDAGELDEFPGVPDTNGEVFTVNCPVPVLAPTTFEG